MVSDRQEARPSTRSQPPPGARGCGPRSHPHGWHWPRSVSPARHHPRSDQSSRVAAGPGPVVSQPGQLPGKPGALPVPPDTGRAPMAVCGWSTTHVRRSPETDARRSGPATTQRSPPDARDKKPSPPPTGVLGWQTTSWRWVVRGQPVHVHSHGPSWWQGRAPRRSEVAAGPLCDADPAHRHTTPGLGPVCGPPRRSPV